MTKMQILIKDITVALGSGISFTAVVHEATEIKTNAVIGLRQRREFELLDKLRRFGVFQ